VGELSAGAGADAGVVELLADLRVGVISGQLLGQLERA